MAEKSKGKAKIPSIKITDKDTGTIYELDFCRESIRFAEARGFDLDDVGKYPVTKFPEFFFYAFRMHHRGLAKTQTDALYDRLGGFSPEFLERMILLYQQALEANNVAENTEEMGKNGNVAVEL